MRILELRKTAGAGGVICGAILTAAVCAADPEPYAGQQARVIAALSETDIAALEAGQGWGFAKPAELNGWPGPAHVLELAQDLELSREQREAVAEIHGRMAAEARRLGPVFIATEAALDAAFAGGNPDREEIARLSAAAGAARAELRAVHLAAHLETAPVLTRHQRMQYDILRGYAAGNSGADHHGHHGAHGKE